MRLPETLPASVFAVKQVVSGDDKEKQFITVERGGFEYVQRPGRELGDERNQPLAGWSKWTIGFVAEKFVLFTDGERDLSVRVGD
jgi:hypothetical protein